MKEKHFKKRRQKARWKKSLSSSERAIKKQNRKKERRSQRNDLRLRLIDEVADLQNATVELQEQQKSKSIKSNETEHRPSL